MADTLPPPPKGGQKSWPKHPAGLTQLVLVDLINLGHRVKAWQNQKKTQPRIALVWQSAKIEPRDDGQPGKRWELAREFTYSTFQNARLRPFLESWMGTKFASEADAEAALQALPTWVGKNGLGSITHETIAATGKTWVNVDAIVPLMEGMTPLAPLGYTRNPFWEKKKAQYAADVLAFEQEKLTQTAKEAETLADFPAALAAGDDDQDLPF